ncbi:TetR/AcrR family transcriptional regulator [Mycolicibacterium setense]
MARKHGWAGRPPDSEEEAVERIIAAAIKEMSSRGGAEVTLAEVAKALGVIRQTVYRYFPSSEALMKAAAIASVDAYMTRLREHVRGINHPAEALTEAIAFTLENIAQIPPLGLYFQHPRVSSTSINITSKNAVAFGRNLVEQFDVDWAAAGFDDAGLDELVEAALRTMQSFFLAPGDSPRDPLELRSYLRRWVGGAIDAHIYRSVFCVTR